MNTEPVLPGNQQPPGPRTLRLVSPSEETSNAAASLAPSPPSPALRRLQRELTVSLAEARSLRELLEELPSILERKFQQRLQSLLLEQRQLELENERLQKHLVAVLSGGDPTLGPQALPAAQGETTLNPEGPPASDAMGGESSLLQGLGLRRALRRRLQR
jgi:hypothetical protein